MEIFGSPICDEDLLVLDNATNQQQLEECLKNPMDNEKIEGGDHLVIGEEM